MKKKHGFIRGAGSSTAMVSDEVGIPAKIVKEFQEITDILGEVMSVPAVLIMKTTETSASLEVLSANVSKMKRAPFQAGEILPMEGQPYEKVILTKKKVLVEDVAQNKKWNNCSLLERDLVSFLGYPICWPEGEIFGIICVMDSQVNAFNPLFEKLLCRFKNEVELMLKLLYYEVESNQNNIDRKCTEDKLSSVGVLAGGIAQDFNSLLSVIIGNISLARLKVPPGEKVYELLLESEKASCQAADIAEKLITFSEGGWIIRREEKLSNILNEILEAGSLPSGIYLKRNVPIDLTGIFVDEGQFKHVLINLLENAAEAMPEGGEVELKAREIELDENEIPSLQAGKYIEIAITDHGVGIPRENLNKIFDPYFSTKNSVNQKGMGLGLSICYSIMKKHEGWITFDSEVGKGTTVYLYIPAFSEERAREALNV